MEADGVSQSLSDWTARSVVIGYACVPLCTLVEMVCVLWSFLKTDYAGSGDSRSGQFQGPIGEVYRRSDVPRVEESSGRLDESR